MGLSEFLNHTVAENDSYTILSGSAPAKGLLGQNTFPLILLSAGGMFGKDRCSITIVDEGCGLILYLMNHLNRTEVSARVFESHGVCEQIGCLSIRTVFAQLQPRSMGRE